MNDTSSRVSSAVCAGDNLPFPYLQVREVTGWWHTMNTLSVVLDVLVLVRGAGNIVGGATFPLAGSKPTNQAIARKQFTIFPEPCAFFFLRS